MSLDLIYTTIGLLEAKLFKTFLLIKYLNRLLHSGISTIAPEENCLGLGLD